MPEPTPGKRDEKVKGPEESLAPETPEAVTSTPPVPRELEGEMSTEIPQESDADRAAAIEQARAEIHGSTEAAASNRHEGRRPELRSLYSEGDLQLWARGGPFQPVVQFEKKGLSGELLEAAKWELVEHLTAGEQYLQAFRVMKMRGIGTPAEVTAMGERAFQQAQEGLSSSLKDHRQLVEVAKEVYGAESQQFTEATVKLKEQEGSERERTERAKKMKFSEQSTFADLRAWLDVIGQERYDNLVAELHERASSEEAAEILDLLSNPALAAQTNLTEKLGDLAYELDLPGLKKRRKQ